MVDQITLLIGAGFTEEQVLDMTMERFFIYVESASRWRTADRKVMVADTHAAIGMALSGKGLKKYLEALSKDE